MSVGNALRANNRKVISQGFLRFANGIIERLGLKDSDQEQALRHAFASVPRDQFMPEALRSRATEDHAFPIGYGQTISKPSTVARMLAVADIKPGMKVLEVGCGSGYCSAIIAALGADVFAVEYIGFLARLTRRKLDELNFHTILIRSGDGRKGWVEHAPYDAIIVSAAFDQIERELIDQLVKPNGAKPGGRLVAPIGDAGSQRLMLWEATTDGAKMTELEECRFVEGQ